MAVARSKKLRFRDVPDIIAIPAVGRGEPWTYRSKPGRARNPYGKEDMWGADAVDAIARARGLAAQMNSDGSEPTVRWPVYWFTDTDSVMIFNGRDDGFVSIDELWSDDVGKGVPEEKAVVGPAQFANFSRKRAIEKLRGSLCSYDHFGKVPGADEILPLDERSSSEERPALRAVSPDRESVATTASSVPASIVNSGIDRWIADTGCGHDLVQASDVGSFKRFLEPYT